MKKAVFIDKDGTLIKDVPYNVDTSLIVFEANAIDALRQLQQAGYQLIIVSNQSGVALSYFTEAAITTVHHYIKEHLQLHGVQLDGFYYCPHHLEGTNASYAKACDCRKPMPGLLLQAAQEMGINLAQSWMIGDILNDVEAGNRAGCRTILFNNGNETEWMLNSNRQPTYMCSGWAEAALLIAEAEKENSRVEHL